MANEEIIKEAWKEEIDPQSLVTTNGKYTNIQLGKFKDKQGLEPGQFVTLRKHDEYGTPYTTEKSYTKGDRTWTTNMHRCTVMVGDTEASFFTFNDEEAEAFSSAASVGEQFQVSKEKFTYKTKKGEQVSERLVFRPVPQ